MPSPSLWKIFLAAALFFTLVAFVLGWVGFGVPDWHQFQYSNGSTVQYYGLWAYCQQSSPFFTSVCRRWPDAANQLYNGSRPNFVSTADGLITTGMIVLSLGFIAGVFAAILPLLCYVAGGLMFLAFLFIVIGVPIFGNQSNNLSNLLGNSTHSKRYGFGLMIATIVLSFIAAILFLVAGFLYQRFGFGNIATNAYSKRPYGGQRLLGPANVLRGMPYATTPGFIGNPYQYQVLTQPSLLSQYIAQRMPRYSGPTIVRRTVVTALPQASIGPAVGAPAYVTPAYYRAPSVNLTGQTLLGPVVRSA